MLLIRTLSLFSLGCLLGAAPALGQGAPFRVELPGETRIETALEGYCPVCVVEMKKWQPGDPRFASVYDGQRYLFPSANEKAAFDADPARYAVAAGGNCVVCQVEMGRQVRGDVRHAARYDGRVYLFPDDAAKNRFLADPARYADADLAYDGDCAVCRVDKGVRMPGDASHSVVFEGRRYLFPDDAKRAAFVANPARYAERQGG